MIQIPNIIKRVLENKKTSKKVGKKETVLRNLQELLAEERFLEASKLAEKELELPEDLWATDHRLLLDILMGDYAYRDPKSAALWVLQKGDYEEHHPQHALCCYAALGEMDNVRKIFEIRNSKGLETNVSPHPTPWHPDPLEFALDHTQTHIVEFLLGLKSQGKKCELSLIRTLDKMSQKTTPLSKFHNSKPPEILAREKRDLCVKTLSALKTKTPTFLKIMEAQDTQEEIIMGMIQNLRLKDLQSIYQKGSVLYPEDEKGWLEKIKAEILTKKKIEKLTQGPPLNLN